MNCLVIGYGSIGSRHAAILSSMGFDISLVTRKTVKKFACFSSIKSAFVEKKFDYVIICNPTAFHYQTLLDIKTLGYEGLLLIEKPLFDKPQKTPKFDLSNTYVAYNLRFHPVIQELHAMMKGKKIYSVQAYVGQYLPDWRGDVDYRKTYSASSEMGGGVLLDLSHELDYLNWLTGPWNKVTGIGGRFGDLNITSDDVFCVMMQMENCPALVLQMNYLDRQYRREIIVNMEGCSFKVDLVKNIIDSGNQCKSYAVSRDDTYILQHQALLAGDQRHLCSFQEGFELMVLIQKIRIAAAEDAWTVK